MNSAAITTSNPSTSATEAAIAANTSIIDGSVDLGGFFSTLKFEASRFAGTPCHRGHGLIAFFDAETAKWTLITKDLYADEGISFTTMCAFVDGWLER